MNRKVLHVTFLLIFVFAFAALLNSGCDFKNPTEGLKVKVKNIPRTTTVRVEFLDTKTGAQIGSDSPVGINVKFAGDDADKVISTTNEPITEASTQNGVLFFAIQDGVIPSTTNPVEVKLVCTSNKYISTSKILTITKTKGNPFQVFMTSSDAAAQPAGVSTNKKATGTTGGAAGTSTDINLSSSDVPTTEPTSSISVPAGTILKDKAGNILTGDIETSVSYYDPRSESALDGFPGGFQVETDTEGKEVFITAGFTAIDITVGGTPVETFENGTATVEFDIPAEVMNPNTGNTIQPGEKIPMWSYDEENGDWAYEGDYTVTKSHEKANMLKVVKENVMHLSWWNLDYHYNACYMGRTIILNLADCYSYLYFRAYLTSTDQYVMSGYTPWDNQVTLLWAPKDVSVYVKFYETWSDYYYGNLPLSGEYIIDDLCFGDPVVFDIACPCEYQPIDVYVSAVCPNGNTLDQGTIDIELLKNGVWQYLGTVEDGFMHIECLAFGTYTVRVFYDGEYYEKEFTVEGSPYYVEVPLESNIDLCQ